MALHISQRQAVSLPKCILETWNQYHDNIDNRGQNNHTTYPFTSPFGPRLACFTPFKPPISTLPWQLSSTTSAVVAYLSKRTVWPVTWLLVQLPRTTQARGQMCNWRVAVVGVAPPSPRPNGYICICEDFGDHATPNIVSGHLSLEPRLECVVLPKDRVLA